MGRLAIMFASTWRLQEFGNHYGDYGQYAMDGEVPWPLMDGMLCSGHKFRLVTCAVFKSWITIIMDTVNNIYKYMYYTILYYTILYHTIPYHTILYYSHICHIANGVQSSIHEGFIYPAQGFPWDGWPMSWLSWLHCQLVWGKPLGRHWSPWHGVSALNGYEMIIIHSKERVKSLKDSPEWLRK